MTRAEALLAAAAAPQRTTLVLAVLAAAGAAAAGAVLLGLSGWFIAAAAAAGLAGPIAAQAFNYMLPAAAVRFLAIVRTGARLGERILAHEAALKTLAALRPALLREAAAAPPHEVLALRLGDAAARVTQDVDALEVRLVRAPAPFAAIAAIATAAVLIGIATPLGAVAYLAAAAAAVYAARVVARRAADSYAAALQGAMGDLKAQAANIAAAAAEIRAYDLEATALDALDAAAEAVAALQVRRTVSAALADAWLGVGAGLATALVAATLAGQAPPLAALAILAALGGMEASQPWVRAVGEARQADAARRRLDGMIGAAEALGASPTGAQLELGAARLAPGASVALVGESGVGKSMVIEGLLGLRPAPPELPLTVGGVPPSAASRRLFAYAPQREVAVSDTVRGNLDFGARVADAELWAALEDACLAERVRQLPHGLDTWIGDRGDLFSGGELKRLALARAYLRHAPWLLLDEPTESLDAATESEVIARLRRRLRRTGQGALIATHSHAVSAACARVLDVGRVHGRITLTEGVEPAGSASTANMAADARD